ncbi:phage tail protein [Paenibacillus sp. FSL H7-0940]|uniref:phage tail protein n=1 Tax=Paenibacillus sp. FSL H7-0940 TaxID=2921443 RepID=UPI0030EF4851
MATTPNLGLPLIDGAMTADVPRDMNALANAVDTAVEEALADVSIPDASLTVKGKVQLSNSTSGTSETVAATEKAVNDAKVSVVSDYIRQPGFATTGGTSTAYTATLTPIPTTLPDGFGITIVPHIANGASPTLNVNGLGAVPLKDQKGIAYAAGKLAVGKPYTFRKVGSDFLADSSGGSGTAVAGDIRAGKTATNDDGDVTGTLAVRGTTVIAPSTVEQNFPSGIYPNFTVQAMQRYSNSGVTVPAGSTITVPVGFIPVFAACKAQTDATYFSVSVANSANGGFLSGMSQQAQDYQIYIDTAGAVKLTNNRGSQTSFNTLCR